jgi:periplasmic divalent cation tolerance protein
MNNDAVEVHITCPSREQATVLARALVEERLAACVNILENVRSVFHWNGALNEEDEVLCLVKTRRELFAALSARVAELHPYDVPEILAFEVAAGSPAYLNWLRESTRAPSS